jgi:trans-2-enoyl-CoA reductase
MLGQYIERFTISRLKIILRLVLLASLTAADINGKTYVSVNKALVTQASSAIPVIPLYISLCIK